MYSNTSGWGNSLTQKCIIFVIALFTVSFIVFPGKLYEPAWLIAAFLIFSFSLLAISEGSVLFRNSSEKGFRERIFLFSFCIRLIIMLILYIVSYQTLESIYYVGAKDEMRYFRIASEASSIFSLDGFKEGIEHILNNYRDDISDTGFAIFQSILIFLLGRSPFLIKILYCLIGSLAVLRGYKLAGLLFEKKIARLAAILLMLYPVSWFYSAVMLKESLMVLLITEALIQLVNLQHQLKAGTLIKMLLLIVLLFFFRSAISILMIIVSVVSLMIFKYRTHMIPNILLVLAIVVIYIYFLKSTGRAEDYYEQYIEVTEYSEQRISYMERLNPYLSLISTPVYVGLALIGPFPSLVKVPLPENLSHNEYYYHVAGNLFWIVMVFFSLYGLYHAIRYRRKISVVLWSFIIGYQFVLLKAMMFTSVRFSYPAKPFFLMMAAYGIYQMKSKKWYPLYLAVALVMVIGWNYVRMKGRGE